MYGNQFLISHKLIFSLTNLSYILLESRFPKLSNDTNCYYGMIIFVQVTLFLITYNYLWIERGGGCKVTL